MNLKCAICSLEKSLKTVSLMGSSTTLIEGSAFCDYHAPTYVSLRQASEPLEIFDMYRKKGVRNDILRQERDDARAARWEQLEKEKKDEAAALQEPQKD